MTEWREMDDVSLPPTTHRQNQNTPEVSRHLALVTSLSAIDWWAEPRYQGLVHTLSSSVMTSWHHDIIAPFKSTRWMNSLMRTSWIDKVFSTRSMDVIILHNASYFCDTAELLLTSSVSLNQRSLCRNVTRHHLQLLFSEFIINPLLKVVPQIHCFSCLFVSSCRNVKLHIHCVTSSFKMSAAAEVNRHELVCSLRWRRVTMRLDQKK